MKVVMFLLLNLISWRITWRTLNEGLRRERRGLSGGTWTERSRSSHSGAGTVSGPALAPAPPSQPAGRETPANGQIFSYKYTYTIYFRRYIIHIYFSASSYRVKFMSKLMEKNRTRSHTRSCSWMKSICMYHFRSRILFVLMKDVHGFNNIVC